MRNPFNSIRQRFLALPLKTRQLVIGALLLALLIALPILIWGLTTGRFELRKRAGLETTPLVNLVVSQPAGSGAVASNQEVYLITSISPQTGVEVSAVQTVLTFQPSKVDITRIEYSSLFPTIIVDPTTAIDTRNGQINLSAGVNTSQTPTFPSGNTEFARIYFKFKTTASPGDVAVFQPVAAATVISSSQHDTNVLDSVSGTPTFTLAQAPTNPPSLTPTPTATPNLTPTPTPTNLVTPTPTVTPTPGQGTATPTPEAQRMTFKVKFVGVTGANATGAKIRIRFRRTGFDRMLDRPLQVTHAGNGVYEVTALIEGETIPVGNDYFVYLTAEKHLRRRYCQGQGGKLTLCGDVDTGNIQVNAGGANAQVFDFTDKPLEPGDTKDPTTGTPDNPDSWQQDTVVNAQDYARIVAKLSIACASLSANDKLIADLDYSGCVDTYDMFLFQQTLSTKQGD